MRKLWCAGAVVSGLLLLGAGPARADENTTAGPATPSGTAQSALSTALGYALEPTNGRRAGTPLVADPLSGQPLGGRPMLQLDPGKDRALLQVGENSTPAVEDTRPARTTRRTTPLVPSADVLRGTVPAARTGAFGGLPVRGVPMPLAGQDVHLASVPVDGLVGRLSGLTPAGLPSGTATGPHTPGTRTFAPDERPVAPRLERQRSGETLLGGLAGALPVVTRHVADIRGSRFSGMPFGGRPVPVGRAAGITVPDDGSTPDPSVSPSTPAGPSAPISPAAPISPSIPVTSPVLPSGPAAPTSPAAGDESPAATPAGTGDTPAAPAQPSTPAGFAADNPKPAGEPGIDDPRLLEEPVDGFVTRGKQ